jgi:ABC-2 type transport system ATP-binding protein
MSDEIAIKVDGIGKTFHEQVGSRSFKEAFISIGKKLVGKKTDITSKDYTALKQINFEVKKGEFFGIVGRNGSGKSTLLKIIAGVYTPTSGSVSIVGNLTPFIELGVGFNPELSGKDNVYLNGALLGFNRKQMDEMYDDIVEFAELKEFMNVKLKNYSSGMQVRLAFSVAIRADSDILLIDEVLAVGDAIFQKKCYNYFKSLKKNKKTVVFVSHDTNALLEYCDRGIIINDSESLGVSKIENTVNDYLDILNRSTTSTNHHSSSEFNKINRWGTGEVVIEDMKIIIEKNSEKSDDNRNINVQVDYCANLDVDSPVYGITISDSAGQRVFVSNTKWLKIKTNNLNKGKKVKVFWKIPNAFNSGEYTVTPAVADSVGNIIYDCIEGACTFTVNKKIQSNAYINVEHEITVKQI